MSQSTVTANSRYIFYKRKGSNSNPWDEAWSATSSTNNADTTTTPRGRAHNFDNGTFHEIDRSVITFDTSGIPANSTISSVRMYWYRKNECYEAGYCSIEICPVSQTGANAGYYNKAYFGTSVGSIPTVRSFGSNGDVNAWTNLLLTTSCIVKGGTTLLGTRIGNDYHNSDPGTNKQNYMNCSFDSGYRPYLIITYTTPPIITTGVATDLQPISATLAGNVTDTGGGTVSTRGVCWATTENPTTDNSKTETTGTTGAYTVSATGLLPGTLYHYRAYVTTENSTTYGADVTFRTPGGAIMFNLL